MRKHLTTLLLIMAAFIGVMSMGGTAMASGANCTTPSPQPVYNWGTQGFRAPNIMSCTHVDAVQFQEKAFIGGCGINCTWVYGTYQTGGSGHPALDPACGTDAGCSNDTFINQIDSTGLCPVDVGTGNSYHNGIAYWWGHAVMYRIHSNISGQWGSWSTFGVSSAGTYTAC